MGWFSRAIRNPVNWIAPGAGFIPGLDPGPNGRDTPGPFGPSASPYDPSVRWDAQGFPVGPMPRGGDMPLEYQYEANRRTEQRRQALWNDAQGSIRQGLDLFQSYRPGGSAALASGMFGQSAGLYGQQAQTLEAPDLLIDWRRDKQAKADLEAKRAQRFSQVMGVFQFGAQVASAASGGGPVAAAATLPSAGAPPTVPGATVPGGGGVGGGVGAAVGGGGYGQPGGQPARVGGVGTVTAPGMTPGAPDLLPGGGSSGGFAGGGGGPARRGASPGPGGPGGAPPGGPGGGGGPAGPGGAGAGVGGDGNFSQTAVAANRAATAPFMASMIADELAEDPRRQFKTSMMVNYAMRELALAGA